MLDYDMSFEGLEKKYGPLRLIDGDWVDGTGRVRRINHSRANGDLMHEMQAGRIFHSPEDSVLTFQQLVDKYGALRLTEENYWVDKDDIIRRILPYTPLVR